MTTRRAENRERRRVRTRWPLLLFASSIFAFGQNSDVSAGPAAQLSQPSQNQPDELTQELDADAMALSKIPADPLIHPDPVAPILRPVDRLVDTSIRSLHSANRNLFMFELLVPPEKAQLDKLKGDKKAYDRELRPRLMLEALRQLQDAHVEPDVWKIEGLDRREDCERMVAAARGGGREKVSCIILGRGEDDKKVREWLLTAAGVPGFIGFAVGRTDFWDPLVDWRSKKTTRAVAVAQIARRYREFVDIFESARVEPSAA